MARLFVARPTGHRTEVADTGTWAMNFAFRLREFQDITQVHFFNISNARILMNRNICVSQAKQLGCTHLLFLDPDMVPDYYVEKDQHSVPFFHAAWPFIKAHPASIAAAPYCGPPPDEIVHVFVRTDRGDVSRLPRGLAATQRGWRAVEGVGTGLMLIDMAVFDQLEPPWFDDVYTDANKTQLHRSQDVHFCLTCRHKGIGIYVNFDCWALHYQPCLVHRPGWKQGDGIEHVRPSEVAPDPSIPVLSLATK